MADETISNLLVNSEDLRKCSLAKNSDRYTEGNEYCASHPDTLSDGDNRGRDPEDEGGSIGTKKDIQMNNCLIVKNHYNSDNEYAAGSCFSG